jgi:hypothetical protein
VTTSPTARSRARRSAPPSSRSWQDRSTTWGSTPRVNALGPRDELLSRYQVSLTLRVVDANIVAPLDAGALCRCSCSPARPVANCRGPVQGWSPGLRRITRWSGSCRCDCMQPDHAVVDPVERADLGSRRSTRGCSQTAITSAVHAVVLPVRGPGSYGSRLTAEAPAT